MHEARAEAKPKISHRKHALDGVIIRLCITNVIR